MLQITTMKTAKIVEITKVNEWEWPHGKLYYINMKLDNNELISLGKKKSDAFKVWDTVSYEDYTDDKGKTKQREVKENPFKPKQFNQEAQNKGAMVWMSYKLAFELVYKKDDDFQTAVALANRIYEEAMATYNGGESESKIEDSTENDDLPF